MFKSFRLGAASLVLVVFGWLFINSATQAYAQSESVVVAGDRIGPIALGMSQADVLAALGNPIETTNGADGVWISYRYTDFIVFVEAANGRVFQVGTYSAAFATAEGVHIGSAQLEVDARLRQSHRRDNPGGASFWIYTYRTGMQVHLNAGVVTHITVYSPRGMRM